MAKLKTFFFFLAFLLPSLSFAQVQQIGARNTFYWSFVEHYATRFGISFYPNNSAPSYFVTEVDGVLYASAVLNVKFFSASDTSLSHSSFIFDSGLGLPDSYIGEKEKVFFVGLFDFSSAYYDENSQLQLYAQNDANYSTLSIPFMGIKTFKLGPKLQSGAFSLQEDVFGGSFPFSIQNGNLQIYSNAFSADSYIYGTRPLKGQASDKSYNALSFLGSSSVNLRYRQNNASFGALLLMVFSYVNNPTSTATKFIDDFPVSTSNASNVYLTYNGTSRTIIDYVSRLFGVANSGYSSDVDTDSGSRYDWSEWTLKKNRLDPSDDDSTEEGDEGDEDDPLTDWPEGTSVVDLGKDTMKEAQKVVKEFTQDYGLEEDNFYYAPPAQNVLTESAPSLYWPTQEDETKKDFESWARQGSSSVSSAFDHNANIAFLKRLFAPLPSGETPSFDFSLDMEVNPGVQYPATRSGPRSFNMNLGDFSLDFAFLTENQTLRPYLTALKLVLRFAIYALTAVFCVKQFLTEIGK